MDINALKQRSRFRKYEADWQASRRALFVQGDQSVANQAGASFRADMNNELQAVVTNSSGTASPGTTYAYQYWADTTNGLLKQRNAANTGWIVRNTLAETFLLSRSSNTILGVGDYGRTFLATAGFTQTLTAAATLGDGWWCEFINGATAAVTIDPNASETIDGALTTVLRPGEGCYITCNGSLFRTVGLGRVSRHGADVASATTTDLDATGADVVDVSGTTTITAITLSDGNCVTVRFTGALTLTNGASLVLPNGANILTAAGDFAIFRGYAAGVVRCVSYVKANTFKQPTRQTFLSGSGTYTTPAGVTRIFVRMIGGGGGGAGSGSAPGAPGAAGDTTFSTLTAAKGAAASAATGGAGGAGTNGDLNITGGTGATAGTVNTSWGGYGGMSAFGGQGPGGGPGIPPSAGAVANTGSGGGGAGQNATASGGGGGGAGAYVEKTISAPAATYSYAVGAGGTAGGAGGGGSAGGAGGSGIIIVDEYYA